MLSPDDFLCQVHGISEESLIDSHLRVDGNVEIFHAVEDHFALMMKAVHEGEDAHKSLAAAKTVYAAQVSKYSFDELDHLSPERLTQQANGFVKKFETGVAKILGAKPENKLGFERPAVAGSDSAYQV